MSSLTLDWTWCSDKTAGTMGTKERTLPCEKDMKLEVGVAWDAIVWMWSSSKMCVEGLVPSVTVLLEGSGASKRWTLKEGVWVITTVDSQE